MMVLYGHFFPSYSSDVGLVSFSSDGGAFTDKCCVHSPTGLEKLYTRSGNEMLVFVEVL